MKHDIDNIQRLRKEVASELEALFLELKTVGHAQGKYLFEGEWRTREQITALYAELKRKDRRIFFELLLAMLAFAGATSFLVLILYSACCSE